MNSDSTRTPPTTKPDDSVVVNRYRNLADADVLVTELPPEPLGDPRSRYYWQCAGCGEHPPRPMALFVVETRAGRHADECDAKPPKSNAAD